MKNIEIPLVRDRDRTYRLFEILPGTLSWFTLALPIILSFISPTLAAMFIIAYMLVWFIKALALNVRILQGYRLINQTMSYDWQKLLNELDNPAQAFKLYEQGIAPKWHRKNLISMQLRDEKQSKNDIYHVVIIAIYNESREIIEPTIKTIIDSNYDIKRLIVIIAYEERGGDAVKEQSKALVELYKSNFYYMDSIMHPKDLPDEIIGKGANITYAGWLIKAYIDTQNIQYKDVIVTTLDCDNRPHPQYFAAVTYAYIACPDPVHTSFQPIAVFTNNIWDVPAPMRVIATGNSFWNIVLALRPHIIRNFSAHSQSMQALIDTDFWSVRTIVEDGHQYWRTYFKYNGKHFVQPILLPIYQDAVLSNTLFKTLRGQFIQMRRWAWGCSDIAYVLELGWRRKNKVPKVDLFFKTTRLIDSHVTWATAPLLILLAAFVPLYLSPKSDLSIVANQLPIIASRIQTLAMVGLCVSLFVSIKLLPPKPARYKKHKHIFMVLQWIYLPITTIIYSGLSALNAQTRLMFGWYLGKFDLTEKAIKK